jgi:condensin complex subunit 3
LEDFNEEEYRKLAELKDLFDFLDDIIPEDEEEIDINAPKKGRSTRKRLVFLAGCDVGLRILQQEIRERHQQQYGCYLCRL